MPFSTQITKDRKQSSQQAFVQDEIFLIASEWRARISGNPLIYHAQVLLRSSPTFAPILVGFLFMTMGKSYKTDTY